jgi:hypothetical protein
MTRDASASGARFFGALLAALLLLPSCGGGGGSGDITCRNVLDCPAGLLCLNGICRVGGGGGDASTPCSDASPCPGGQVCTDGRCVSADGGSTGCSCAPEDPCTAVTPGCADGGCARTGSECLASGDCEDGEPCTVDRCVCGYCEVEASADEGCCVTSAECDDGAACTIDTCVFNRCRHEGAPGCCARDADCDDLDPCTVDLCRDETCAHEPLGGGCCTSDRECDDGEWCTKDACVGGRCVHPRTVPDPRCGCATSAMCEDGNPCTTDRCEDRVCRYAAVTSAPAGLTCCTDATDCDDGALATTDTCVLNTCLRRPRPTCTADGDCAGAYACTESRCAQGVCVPAGTWIDGCCESDLECDDDDTCTVDTCSATNRCSNVFQLQPGCCQNDAQCDDGLACTTEFCCRSDLCTGTTTSVTRNHCTYTIRPGEGCCTNDLTCDDHLPCTFDVCVDGTCLNLPTGETCCAADGDCDDRDPCTVDRCQDGACLNDAIPGCCDASTDCDDRNRCTIDTCNAGTCAHARIPECCTTDSECNDHDVCTQDRCDPASGTCTHPRLSPCCEVDADCTSDDPCRAGTCNAAKDCVYAQVAGCCRVTADCDDGDPCTIDACVASRCHHQASSAPACCQPTYTWQNGFPYGAVSVDTWTFNPPSVGYGWQVVSGRPVVSAPYSLYYGNPSTNTYVTQFANLGSARTPVITLPNEERVFLNAWVWMELLNDPTADFQIRVVPGPTYSATTTLWDESLLGGNTGGEFRFVGLDLSPWRGQSVIIEFWFSTQKVTLPAGEGVYVDDIDIGHGCVPSPVECQIDADCADADPCTEAACVDQSCNELTVAGPTCCARRAYTATFDDGTLQGVSSGLVPGASTRYAWTPSEHRAASAPGSLYFGDPTRPCTGGEPGAVCPTYGDHLVPERAAGTADIGPLTLSGFANPILSFQLWADIDPIASVEPDRLDVVVISPATGQETVAWSSFSEGLQSTGGRFRQVVVSLEPWAGQPVRVRFLFATVDGFGFGEGVYVDDVSIGEDCR